MPRFWRSINMEELSLHILDIVQNSIAADARLIGVEIVEDAACDTLTITICDDGKGMSRELLERVCDPFTTGRKTRRVGMGLPLFKLAAESTGGSFEITSEPGKGTTVRAVFTLTHIDRQPLGDIALTMQQIITANEQIDFVYTHTVGDKSYTLDTREVKRLLDGVALSDMEVVLWLGGYLRENERELSGGEDN